MNGSYGRLGGRAARRTSEPTKGQVAPAGEIATDGLDCRSVKADARQSSSGSSGGARSTLPRGSPSTPAIAASGTVT
jgi:hypothetical protein